MCKLCAEALEKRNKGEITNEELDLVMINCVKKARRKESEELKNKGVSLIKEV